MLVNVTIAELLEVDTDFSWVHQYSLSVFSHPIIFHTLASARSCHDLLSRIMSVVASVYLPLTCCVSTRYVPILFRTHVNKSEKNSTQSHDIDINKPGMCQYYSGCMPMLLRTHDRLSYNPLFLAYCEHNDLSTVCNHNCIWYFLPSLLLLYRWHGVNKCVCILLSHCNILFVRVIRLTSSLWLWSRTLYQKQSIFSYLVSVFFVIAGEYLIQIPITSANCSFEEDWKKGVCWEEMVWFGWKSTEVFWREELEIQVWVDGFDSFGVRSWPSLHVIKF